MIRWSATHGTHRREGTGTDPHDAWLQAVANAFELVRESGDGEPITVDVDRDTASLTPALTVSGEVDVDATRQTWLQMVSTVEQTAAEALGIGPLRDTPTSTAAVREAVADAVKGATTDQLMDTLINLTALPAVRDAAANLTLSIVGDELLRRVPSFEHLAAGWRAATVRHRYPLLVDALAAHARQLRGLPTEPPDVPRQAPVG